MEWYENPAYDAAQYDKEAPWLNKAIAPKENMIVTFISMMDKVRPDDTQIGKPGDTFYTFYFKDEEGTERTIDQNSPKGAFFKAMRSAQVKEGEKIRLSREGENVDTRWSIEKHVDGEWKVVEDKKDIPF